jgi:sugar-specific transcriptional regulator TrmB
MSSKEEEPEHDSVADVESDILEEVKIQKRREMDKLSLELLSNTSQYKKYLAKTDPNETAKRNETSVRLQRNKERVTSMLLNLLDEYEDLTTYSTTGNTEIQRQFKTCIDKIIDFVEWTNYKQPLNQDLDMMFDYTGPENKSVPVSNLAKSFWGKKVTKYS